MVSQADHFRHQLELSHPLDRKLDRVKQKLRKSLGDWADLKMSAKDLPLASALQTIYPNSFAEELLELVLLASEQDPLLDNAFVSFFERLESTYFTRHLKRVRAKYPHIDLREVLSKGQILSKNWLLQKATPYLIELENPMVFVLGGWYASLSAMIFDCPQLAHLKIRSIDKDPICEPIAEEFNREMLIKDWSFKAVTEDMMNINYLSPELILTKSNGEQVTEKIAPQVIINTSCEHLKLFNEWYDRLPKEKLLILQSNDYFSGSDHLNCSNSLSDFKKQCPMKKQLFSGTLNLGMYNRFMLIGYK